MNVDELVFYNRLREIEKNIRNAHNRLIVPRSADFDKEEILKEYKEFASLVESEIKVLSEMLILVQPDLFETLLGIVLKDLNLKLF